MNTRMEQYMPKNTNKKEPNSSLYLDETVALEGCGQQVNTVFILS